MMIRNWKLIQELAGKIAQKKNDKSTLLAVLVLILYFTYLFTADADDDAEFQAEVDAIAGKE